MKSCGGQGVRRNQTLDEPDRRPHCDDYPLGSLAIGLGGTARPDEVLIDPRPLHLLGVEDNGLSHHTFFRRDDPRPRHGIAPDSKASMIRAVT